MNTPTWARRIKRVVRGSYYALINDFAGSKFHQRMMVSAVARFIKKELHSLSSESGSMVFDKKQHVQEFSWDRLWGHLKQKLPLLTECFKKFVRDMETCKPLVCLIISMLLKQRNKRMCLLQCVFSLILYGNGAAKQVSLQVHAIL